MIGTLVAKRLGVDEQTANIKYSWSVVQQLNGNNVHYPLGNLEQIYMAQTGFTVEFDVVEGQAIVRLTESGYIKITDWETELQKCKNSPYYYFTTYLTLHGVPLQTRYSELEFNNMFKSFALSVQSKPE